MNKASKEGKFEDFETENFAELLEQSFSKNDSATLQGVIVKVEGDEAYVDIGKKSEGILPLSELEDFKIGDSIEVAVVGSRGGRALVSHKKALRKKKVVEFIKNYDENSSENLIDVKVIDKNKGGYICVDDNNVEFFLPRSQYNSKENPIGKSLQVKIIKIDQDEQSIVVSRKKIVEEDRKKRKEIINEILQEDKILEGIIKRITSYGMFVSIDGVDGLVHYSEISYKGHVNPNALYKEGDKVKVKAVKYDSDKKHLSLSIKAAMPDPWNEIKGALDVGDTIKVVVSNIEPYGAFVDIGNDIEGFLHISEISWDKNIKHPKEYISKNEELEVEVIEINPESRRLRVSLKNLLLKPFDEFVKKHKVGDVLKGKVVSLTAFGAFLKIDNVEGLLHNEDTSWDRNSKAKDMFKPGDEFEVKIIKIDTEKQKISLSLRELTQSPIQEYAKSHKTGDIVKGKIKDIKDFGVFVELEPGIDALIHKEDISTKDLENLKKDDEIEAAISLIDSRKHHIRLSVKNLNRIKERQVLKEINNEDKVTLGDVIKEQLS